ncbi:MAG: type II secretion system F family protein [Candidatus Sumerlaeaceae bacterium]|nr:type II secretion system F family protein [Candidatus Sumerlaeaceae bacterium]
MRNTYADIETVLAELAELDAAGLDAGEGLMMLREQAQRPSLQKLLDSIFAHYSNGCSLSEALARAKEWVHPIVRGLVAAGEKSGNLGEALTRASQFLAMRRNVMTALRTAAIYPFAVLTVGTIISAVVAFIAIPHQWRLIEEMHQHVWFSDPTAPARHLHEYAIWAMRGVALAFAAAWVCSVAFGIAWAVMPANPALHRILIRMPGYGQVFRRYLQFHFVSVLELQLVHGIPLSEALDALAEDSDLPLVSSAAHAAKQGLALGAPLSGVVALCPQIFPAREIWFLKQAERYERLPQYLGELSRRLSDEIRNIEVLVQKYEPLAILVLGVMVGSFAISVFLPAMRWTYFVRLGE